VSSADLSSGCIASSTASVARCGLLLQTSRRSVVSVSFWRSLCCAGHNSDPRITATQRYTHGCVMLLVVTSVTSLGPQGHRQGHRVIAEPSSIPAKPVSSVRSTIVFQGWIHSLGTRGLSGGLGGRVCPPPPVQNSISIGSAVSARLTCRLSPAICVLVCAQMYTQRD